MPKRIEIDDVQALLADGAQLVEVLPPAECADEHPAGALSIPLRQLDATSTQVLDKRRAVIVYCWDYL
jgi:rhodanese-related sulfurtransferase